MKDLTNIPEKYHVLFTTDWNMGSDSTMTSIQRTQMNQLYLEYNNWSIQKPTMETTVILTDEMIEKEKM